MLRKFSTLGQDPEFRGKDAILRMDGHSDFGVYAEMVSAKYGPQIDKGQIERDKPFKTYDPSSVPPQPNHMEDFINCIRNGGKPKCNEDEALVEAVTSIMSVIAYQEGRRVRWDAEKREVV